MTEIEQKDVIKCLHARKFGLDEIAAEVVSVNGEQADTKKVAEYWIHQVKLGRSNMEDEATHGRLPPGDIDVRILACLSHEPFSSVRSIAQALALAPAIVHRPLTVSLDRQLRHFRWVPHVFTRRLRDQGERVPERSLMSSASKIRLTFGILSLAMSHGYSST
jgi:hypothetical protein